MTYKHSEYLALPTKTLSNIKATTESQLFDCVEYAKVEIAPIATGVAGFPTIYTLDNTFHLEFDKTVTIKEWTEYTVETSSIVKEPYNYKVDLDLYNDSSQDITGITIYDISGSSPKLYTYDLIVPNTYTNITLFSKATTKPDDINLENLYVLVYKTYDSVEASVNNIEGYINTTTYITEPIKVYAKDILTATKRIDSKLEEQTVDTTDYKSIYMPAVKTGEYSITPNNITIITPRTSSNNNDTTNKDGTGIIQVTSDLTEGYINQKPDTATKNIDAIDLVEGNKLDSIYNTFDDNGENVTNYQFAHFSNVYKIIDLEANIPTTKITDIIYCNENASYYIWED